MGFTVDLVSGKPMTEKPGHSAIETRRRCDDGRRDPTPAFLAWWDPMSDADMAAQVADDLDMPREVDEASVARAHEAGDWLVASEPACDDILEAAE